MKTETGRGAAIVLAAGLLLSSGCIDVDLPEVARVVVEANPAAPLELIVSTNFLQSFNEDTQATETVLLIADTTQLTGDFDREYSIARLRRVYVRVTNDEVTPEQVRLVVFINGNKHGDRLIELSDGDFLDFAFTSRNVG